MVEAEAVHRAPALWLLILYPASFGPLMYLNRRGWFPAEVLLLLHKPLDRLMVGRFGSSSGYVAYTRWWDDLAIRHSASD